MTTTPAEQPISIDTTNATPAIALRAKALAQLAKPRELRIVLDDDHRAAIEAANNSNDAAPTAGDMLADNTPRRATTVSEAWAAAENAGVVLVTTWHRLSPGDYDAQIAQAETDAKTAGESQWVTRLGDQLAAACWIGAQTPDGDPVELSFDELMNQVASHADRDTIRTFVIGINRAGSVLDFPPANSGKPAQK